MKKEYGMKTLVNRVIVLLMVGALASVLAFGKTTRKDVTFGKDVIVNGTLVKAGTYSVAFDDETGELTIIKGTKVVAKTPARLEKLDEDSQAAYVTRSDTDGGTETNVLLSVTLKDRNQATIASDGDSKGERGQ
jgi:hypothetical protein